MKTKLKRLFGILAITTLLLVFGCTEDLYQEETHSKHNLSFKKVSFSEISTNKKLVSKLSKLENKKETKDANGKIVYSSEYDFYVDTDNGNYIEDENGKHSYVFRVYRDSVENKLDNIVFSSQDDDTYKVVLISYDLTTQEQQNLENGATINVSDNTRIFYDIDDENLTSDIFSKTTVISANGCITIVESYCSFGNHPDGQHNGKNCPGYTEDSWSNCDYSGGGNYDGGISIGGFGAHTGSAPRNNSIYTTPTLGSINSIYQDKREKCFLSSGNNNLTFPQRTFINSSNNKELKEEILAYLESQVTNPNADCYSQAGIDFVKEAIATLMNGGEVDFDDEVIIDKSILENPKVKCVYEKLKSLDSKFFNNLLENNFGDKKEANLKFTIENIDNQYLARTFPYINGVNRNYKIVFDTDFIANATTIEIATAFIHEVYHAELYERLYKIGLINTADPNGSITFNDSPITYQFNDELFAQLVLHYTSFTPTSNNPSNYQHNLFNILGYRNNIILNLTELNTLLDNLNSFQNIINNDPLMSNLQDVISNLSWYGLEETNEYLSLNPIEIANINHSNIKVSQFYPQTCN